MISVVIPAHNEERFIGECLRAVHRAAENVAEPVETVVVLNRCTDGTERIASELGAVCVADDSRCIATVRNRGVRAAKGDLIVTCDADSRVHPRMLARVREEIDAGAIGGGADFEYDRRSLGISLTLGIFRWIGRMTGISCGAFWTERSAFEAVGGFDDRLRMAEDVDFAKRLRAYGARSGRCYGTLLDAKLSTSSRKFDAFGDWSFFRHVLVDAFRIRRSVLGRDTEFVDEYFYDFNDRPDGLASPQSLPTAEGDRG